MKVLVVENREPVGRLWCSHLERQGAETVLALNDEQAVNALRFQQYDVLILNINNPDGNGLSVADLATYRCPDIAIIVVTTRSFFSDGSIFDIIPNTRGFLSGPVAPDDLAALVEHYGHAAGAAGQANHARAVPANR